MLFYLFNFLVVLVLSFIFGHKYNSRSKIILISLLSLLFMIESSIRSISVGMDTPNYVHYFEDVSIMPWDEVVNQFIERYILRTEETDIGFFFMIKIISYFTHSYQWYSFIISILFFAPMGFFLYRYTTNIFQITFAYVFFISLFFIFPLSGMRQVQAMGLGILSFIFVERNHYFKAFCCVFVGMFLHYSLLIIVPYILLNYYTPRIGKKLHFISFLIVPFVLLFSNNIIVMMGSAAGVEKYQAYGEGDVQGGASTFVALLLLSSYFCYVAMKKEFLFNNPKIQKLYFALPLMTILGPLIQSNGAMIRVSMYYHFYLMVLIPYAIEQLIAINSKRMVYVVIITILVVFSLLGSSLDYDFYWNDPAGTWK